MIDPSGGDGPLLASDDKAERAAFARAWLVCALQAGKAPRDVLCVAVRGHEPTIGSIVDAGDLPAETPPTGAMQ